MDKSASIAAAFAAGKLPSQKQLSQAVDNALSSPFLTNKPSADVGELSQQGKQLQDGFRQLLLAYKKLGDNKNSDDIVQQSIWHLSQADLTSSSANIMDVDTDKAKSDAHAVAHSLRILFSVFSETVTNEGQSVFHDFSSFLRLSFADAADHVGDSARKAAQVLRKVDTEVAEGQRNEFGLKRKAPEENDVRVQFEQNMDSVKEVGSSAIGAGQAAAQKTKDLANRTSSRLQDAFNKACDRAQNDKDYHKALSTAFTLVEKWVHRSLDSLAKSLDLDDFIDDPTPEKHLISAIRGFRQAIERLSNNTSLDGLLGALHACSVDIQQDPTIRGLLDKSIAYLRKNLNEAGYARSDASQKKREELRAEWNELSSNSSDKGLKWKEDFAVLHHEATKFQTAIDHDEDLRDARQARARLVEGLETTVLAVGAAAADSFMQRAPWFWQDVFNVYLPRLAELVKDVPIPRTEYKDDEVEFVLEDLDISTFSILPGHAYIRNITDIDIKAPSPGQTETAVGTLTRIYLQGLQIHLKEVSFYYNDKTASMGPSEYTGLLEFTLPPQGIDIDIVIRSIPNSPEGKIEREKNESFLDIQRVEVKISEDVSLSVKQSNHQILVSVFRPIMLSRLRETLQTILQQQIYGALESLDKMVWDIGRRAEVFEDTGISRGASLLSGFWSELGHMQRSSDGNLLSGWKATGTGIIKDDKHAQFAMGATPQVLSGEKRGPKGTLSESVEERIDRNVDVSLQGGMEHENARGLAEQAGQIVEGKYQKVKSWKDTVQHKTEEEKRRDGWGSPAFDALWA